MKAQQREELLNTLKNRFEKNMKRHNGLVWADVQARLEANTNGAMTLYSSITTAQHPITHFEDFAAR